MASLLKALLKGLEVDTRQVYIRKYIGVSIDWGSFLWVSL